ncbi:Fructose-bisphosphate aldolase [Aphelenchoides besseyi]|nr:Fructose-bisphosphate aldolase [Aphelenchoides besseyi]KAI6211059.1 Fructose-bisphosphate aldolase [Aphelenchoides besseyi]
MTLILNNDEKRNLREIAARILQPGKGVLASDDTADGLGPRLEAFGLENNAESRRLYRQILYTAPYFGENISSVILIEETFLQKADSGRRFVDILKDHGCVVGVQADQGLEPLTGDGALDGETFTRGLDGLETRLESYRKGGAEFAKWRAALTVKPSELALHKNAVDLAHYALACQKHGLVPFVEPDVATFAGTHSLAEAQRATEQALAFTFGALTQAGVYLEGIILKPNMVTAGVSAPGVRPSAEEIAEATVEAFRRTIPPAVPGCVFLSGGHTDLNATLYLNAIARSKLQKPWFLTFCYGRAIQGPVMQAWAGKQANIKAAHKVQIERTLLHRARSNGLAAKGLYEEEENVAKQIAKLKI